VTIPPPIVLIPHQAEIDQQLARLPQAPGIYCLSSAAGSPHLSLCGNLRRRLVRLLSGPAEGAHLKARLRSGLTRIECWPSGSKLESLLLMFAVSRSLFPEDYLKRLRIRMPWFLGLLSRDQFARLVLVNRIPDEIDLLLGPFATRELAQYYEEEVLGLFQLRRCTETLTPSPEHPGCIYGEMNQCLRPCQCAVTVQEYASETARVSEFLVSNGRSALAALAVARERASEAMEFEEAAQLHKRLERVKNAIAARSEVVADVRQMNGIALTRTAESGEVRLWPMFHGYWQEAIPLKIAELPSPARSLDSQLREALTRAEMRNQDGNRLEHIALFLRWHRSSYRDGEWFPFHSLSDLNYRKLVREISKLAVSAPATGQT